MERNDNPGVYLKKLGLCIPDILGDRKLLVEMEHGSGLYGTKGEDSDTDLKGIFIPHMEEMLLGIAPKVLKYSSGKDTSKNGAEDIDLEYFSLPYFIELACNGETAAIDMIHATEYTRVDKMSPWTFIRENRSKFYTKDMQSLVLYCRKQAGKYGVKGSRVAAIKTVLEDLREWEGTLLHPDVRMSHIWDDLPIIEFAYKQIIKGTEYYVVCDRKIQPTVKLGYAIEMLEKVDESYGHRAQLAASNKGIDWKAISHALRACVQLIEIYETGDLNYPLTDASWLKEIKEGKYPWAAAATQIEIHMDHVESLTATSRYPQSVDSKYWRDFVVTAMAREYGCDPRKVTEFIKSN